MPFSSRSVNRLLERLPRLRYKIAVTRQIALLSLLAFLACTVEGGFDIASASTGDDAAHEAHEMHGHHDFEGEAPDGEDPHGEDTEAEHFCHCVTHAAPLSFASVALHHEPASGAARFSASVYESLALPPPVPPPNA